MKILLKQRQSLKNLNQNKPLLIRRKKKWQYDDLRARRYGGRVLSEHLSTRHASGNSNNSDASLNNTKELMFPYLEEKKIYLRDMHIGFELIHTKKSASFPYLLEKPRALDRLIYDYEKI